MNPTATLRTRVIFRWHKGEVLALFPGLAASTNPDWCLSYAHVGQHAAAHYYGVIRGSRPSVPAEYFPLAQELRRAGYALEIVTCATLADWQARCQTCQPAHAALSAK